ncbi:DUF6415 family natural product biosynthesis protein [Streptomyces sp. NPDC051643]|uniref:DUF6415 family natural product biosynthesis protein n=1 Tax=Streptomyces sp. NPDC051643 TaxID=3365665 RepID=UPI0037AF49B8
MIAAWAPPLGRAALAELLEAVQRWEPYDGDALLDDVAAALDDVAPPAADVEGLAVRLDRHLVQLVNIAAVAEADQPDARTARLVAWARSAHATTLPAGRTEAVGHLRRVGLLVDGLLERLVETKNIREAA